MGLKGYRLWGMGQLDSTCRAPPGVTGREYDTAAAAAAAVALPPASSARLQGLDTTRHISRYFVV
jgi:hypothetical protein